MATWDEFVQAAMRVAQEENYPIGVILGQAALETGRDPNNAAGNNWFGIKGQGNAGWNTLNTQEANPQGQFYRTLSNFAAYQTPEDSIRAYIDLIKTHYPQAYALKDNPAAMIQAIKAGGYATDPNYVSKVMSTPEFSGNFRTQIADNAIQPQNQSPMWQQIRNNIMSKLVPEVQAADETRLSTAQNAQSLAPGESSYTVKPGDTLWDIANKYLGSGSRWHEIGGFTGQPTQLPIGQQLTIPSRTPQGFYDYSAMSRPSQAPSPAPTPQPQRVSAPMSPAIKQPQGFYNYGAMSSQNMSPARPFTPPMSSNNQPPFNNMA